MSNNAKANPSGTYILSDDAMAEMENLEATIVLDDSDDETQDDDATVVLGKTYRLEITGDDKS